MCSDAPDLSYEFCESGWYEDASKLASSNVSMTDHVTALHTQHKCFGWTTNYHYLHLVMQHNSSISEPDQSWPFYWGNHSRILQVIRRVGNASA